MCQLDLSALATNSFTFTFIGVWRLAAGLSRQALTKVCSILGYFQLHWFQAQ